MGSRASCPLSHFPEVRVLEWVWESGVETLSLRSRCQRWSGVSFHTESWAVKKAEREAVG